MRLIHYSNKPLTNIVSRKQEAGILPFPWAKPYGLWVSVEGPDDWPTWCQAEDFGLDRLRYAHEIELVFNPKIYYISTRESIELFTAKFGQAILSGLIVIDWRKLAANFQGIIIAPYIASCRNIEWYSGWDCASGCIWDASAISSYKQIQSPSAPTIIKIDNILD